jgi:hypothetical protein
LNLAAAVTEAADGNLGNKLNQEQVKFTLLNGNLAPVSTCTAPVTLVYSATPGTATASCTTTALAADNYTVNMQLVDKTAGTTFYTAPDEDASATVTDAGTGFTTGGGWIQDPNTNAKSNFGFTVKYLKNSGIQGNSLFIYRRTHVNLAAEYPGVNFPTAPKQWDDYNWIIKSNSWSGGGFTESCSPTTVICTADFSGKNTVVAISRTTGQMFSLGGGGIYSYQVDVTDNGEPGSSASTKPDTYAIRIWTSTGTYYQLGTPTSQVALNGGNLQVKP